MFNAFILATCAGTNVAAAQLNRPLPETAATRQASRQNADIVGMWVTADRHISLELLPNGRYDEARGAERSAYTGSYKVRGAIVDFADDSGFTAQGEIVDGVLNLGIDSFRKL